MDFATTMDALSWEFYNRFYKVLVDYGIVYLPLLIFLYKNWLSEDLLGKDAVQSVVALTVKRMLVSVTMFIFLFYLVLSPIVPLSDVNRFRSADPIPAYDSDFNRNLKKTGDKFLAHDIKIKLPLLWAGMAIFTHKITTVFLDSLPKTAGDIRGAMATAIKNSSIKTPFVRNQYEHFYRNCYSPASGKFQHLVQKGDIVKDAWFFKLWESDIDIKEYDWVGGSFYLENAGFYKQCTAGNECYSSSLIPSGVTTKFSGVDNVSCDWLWNTNGGLRKNLIKEFKLDSALDNDEADDIMRNYLKLSDNFVDLELDKESDKGVLSFITGVGVGIVAWVSEFIVNLVTVVIVAFLPIGLAVLKLIFVVLLPIILLVSALRIGDFIMLIMFYFTISFLPVLWAVAAFIDNNIMNILTGTGLGNDSVSSFSSEIMGRMTTSGAMIALASSFLYYQMTTRWFQLMSMVGAEGAKEASGAMDNLKEGTDSIKNTTPKPPKSLPKGKK